MRSARRKMLAAREDLVDKISDIARKRGTLYDYVNEVLQEAIRADSLGSSLREIIDERGLIKAARDSGFMLIPERLWYEVVDKGYTFFGEDWMENLWYETGQWYGKYYSSLEKFIGEIKKLIWEISELNLYEDEEYLVLKCISPSFSISHSQLFGKFLEGAMEIFGCELVEEDISKGVINLKFRRT